MLRVAYALVLLPVVPLTGAYGLPERCCLSESIVAFCVLRFAKTLSTFGDVLVCSIGTGSCCFDSFWLCFHTRGYLTFFLLYKGCSSLPFLD